MTDDRNALITGISSGLGMGMAEVLLERGFRVFGASRRGAGPLAGRGHLRAVELDLTDFDAVPAALGDLLAGVDRLEWVLLNAGALGELQDMAEVGIADLRRLMEINTWANKVVLDALFAAGLVVDQVVAISSGAAVNASRGWAGYTISKAALNALIKLYAAERPETHFCALAPGLIDTAMQDYLCGLNPSKRYPSLARIQAARGTSTMPQPRQAAERVIACFARLRTLPSGTFTDIRKL